MQEDTLGCVEEFDLLGGVLAEERAAHHLVKFGLRQVDALVREPGGLSGVRIESYDQGLRAL